jgi:dehydrogenase/reductase SDR family protein 7
VLFQGWFDTLRMEAYFDNIKVTMLCPGPVHSNILKYAFTEKPGEVCATVFSIDY